MAINQNHISEELDGIKCAIVEKNASKDRVAFLKSILEANKYIVVVVASPPPKNATPAASASESAEADNAPTQIPETFTIGVTDVRFNPTNAIFGRLLRTIDGHVVTLSYWNQKETVSYDDIPYYETR